MPNYDHYSSIGEMQSTLHWSKLHARKVEYTFFIDIYKIVNTLVDIVRYSINYRARALSVRPSS